MTDRERKAMQMALEALQLHVEMYPHMDKGYMVDAREALRQALAQDEQEPVIDRRLKVKIGRQYGYALNEHWFYLQPADEYAEQALTKHSGISVPPKREWQALVQPEQSPVAWRWENNGSDNWIRKYTYLDNGAPDEPELCEALYTAPVSKPDVNQELVEALNTILWTRPPNKNPSRYAHTVEEIAFRALAKHDKLKEQA